MTLDDFDQNSIQLGKSWIPIPLPSSMAGWEIPVWPRHRGLARWELIIELGEFASHRWMTPEGKLSRIPIVDC